MGVRVSGSDPRERILIVDGHHDVMFFEFSMLNDKNSQLSRRLYQTRIDPVSKVLSCAKIYLQASGGRWIRKMWTPFQKQRELRALPFFEGAEGEKEEGQHKFAATDGGTVEIEEKSAKDEEQPVTIIDQAKVKQIAPERVNIGQREAEVFETKESKHDQAHTEKK